KPAADVVLPCAGEAHGAEVRCGDNLWIYGDPGWLRRIDGVQPARVVEEVASMPSRPGFPWRPAVALLLLAAFGIAEAAAKPRVAPINLCAVQPVRRLSDPTRIATLSWLAADPEESLLAEEARLHPLNYGTAEELLHYAPDVVIAGTYTSSFTRRLLLRLGYA